MKSLGSTLFILGVLAFGLNYMNLEKPAEAEAEPEEEEE